VSDADALKALLDADRWIERVRQQKLHLPEIAELNELESTLRAQAGELQEAQAAAAPVETALSEAKAEAERLAKRAGDLDRSLSNSTSGARDLSAMQKELEHVRELLSAAEDRELELLLALEPLQETVVAIKAAAQPGMARRATLKETITDLSASLDEEIASLVTSRQSVAGAVSGPVLARYESAMARTGISGAAQVVEGRCDGCRIALAPLDLDRWKHQGTEDFMPCPECGRLLLPC